MSDIIKHSNLPTLKELVTDVGVYEKHDKLNFLLNQPVPEKWIANHPFIKTKNEKGQTVPYKYLPIDKVEFLMRKIFKKYRIEILREGESFNGVYVAVRVHYKDFITDEWDYHDGIGAIQLQTKKGMSPADLNNINNGAISMAFPHAKTLAIKDACDMFGKLFGADLNRRDTLGAAMDVEKKVINTDNERLIDYINKIQSQVEIDFIQPQVTEELLPLFKEKIKEVNLKNKK